MRIASQQWMSTNACKGVRSIHHRTHLFGLDQVAPTGLHLSQIGKVGGIGQAGEIREVLHMDLLTSNSLSRNLPNSQRSDFCPLSSQQWDHCSICADDQALGGLWRAGFFLPGLFGLGRLLFLNPFANFLAKPAGCFWTDGDPKQLSENPTRMPKWHPTPELDKMALLPRRQDTGK